MTDPDGTYPAHADILVCGSCPKDAAKSRQGKTLGIELCAEIRALLGDVAARKVRVVNCLAGCRNSCNVALVGPGKTRLRISRLGPGDGQVIVRAARIFAQSAATDLPIEQLPEALRDRLSARSPVRIGISVKPLN